MAKDDYHVLVYQILSYLYQRLKKGEKVDSAMLMYDSPILNINKSYWAYIIYNIAEQELVDGIDFANIDGLDFPYAAKLDECFITPKGIEYLCDNSFMKKAVRYLKEIKEIIPFDIL